ncbi:hypothetical protein F4777DRAFT_411756 [Nemania sp. FL0916]|nr:hypothetical protein F4777DRAFT_411756 [Nemania sp. FL0916]
MNPRARIPTSSIPFFAIACLLLADLCCSLRQHTFAINGSIEDVKNDEGGNEVSSSHSANGEVVTRLRAGLGIIYYIALDRSPRALILRRAVFPVILTGYLQVATMYTRPRPPVFRAWLSKIYLSSAEACHGKECHAMQ